MRLIKPLRASFVHRVFDYKKKHNLVCTVAFCFPFEEPRALVSDPEVWKFVSTDLGRFGVLDYWMFKPHAEVLVTGACYTGEREKGAEHVRLSVGPEGQRAIDKRLYVFGERKWTMLGASEPQMFSRMPIDYGHAFGGEAFAKNPVGKGLTSGKDASGADVHFLPNVEDPKNLMTGKGDRPDPASFSAHDLMWPVHFEKKMGTYSRDWAEKNGYSLAEDIDFTLFNVAPPDQRLPKGFSGRESVRVENMHPDKRVQELEMPGYLGRCFLRFKEKYDPTRKLIEVPLKIDTLHLFPHRERAIVFCRGVLPINTHDATDVELAFIGVDELEESKRRPLSHYEAVLKKRLDPEKGGLEALRDRDLMPESATVPSSGLNLGDPLEDAVAVEGIAIQNAHRRSIKELAKVRETLMAAGMDPALVPEPPPEPPPLPTLDTAPAAIEAAFAEKEKAELLAKEQKAELAAQLATLAQEFGFEAPNLEKNDAPGDGPPKFSVEAEISKIRDLVELAAASGQDVPELREKVSDPNFRAQLLDVQHRLMTAYRLSAHFQNPARAQNDEQSQASKSALLAIMNNIEPELRDFTGADLSGMDLSGIDLEGGLLEAADLTGAIFKAANLQSAVLAHAKLADAVFIDAKLAGANLGRVTAPRADFTNTDLRSAAVHGSNFEGAKFKRAKFGGVQAMDVNFRGADLSEVQAEVPIFLKSDLRETVFRGAVIRQGVFMQCQAAGISAQNSDFSQAAFVQCNADDANFSGAKLENFRIVDSSFLRANFSGCPMLNSNLRGAKLSEANLSFASLRRSDLSQAELQGADMEGVIAVESLFLDTDMTGAKLKGANLMLAIMHRAVLRGADVSQSNLFCADLTGAVGDNKTSFTGANVKRALVAGVFSG